MKTLDKHLFKALDNYPFNLSETIESLEYALSANNQNTLALCLLGRIYSEQLMDYETAKEYFSEAISINLHALDVYPYYIETLILNEDFDEAHRLIDFAMTIKGISKNEILKKKIWLLEVQREFKLAKKALKDFEMHLTDSYYNSFVEETKTRLNGKIQPKKKKKSQKEKSLN